MKKNIETSKVSQKPPVPLNAETDMDLELTAQPKTSSVLSADAPVDFDLVASGIEYGKMNEADAIELGYTDDEGHAVSMAKKDVRGNPTGAYTDIGAGRSSAVHKSSDKSH